jgi:hypothetical protein
MRDYGVVRVRFWDWAKRKGLSIDARTMALYLLTCPHANSLGCFRLPMAYLCDDLGINQRAAAATLEQLAATGFIHRDEESGWTWLTDYLEHNPIPNRNVGKAIEKLLAQVPSTVAFYAALLEAMSANGLDGDLIETLSKRLPNGIDTVSRAEKPITQIQDQDLTHDQTHEQTGAAAPIVVDETDDAKAFAEFVRCAEEFGWPQPRRLDPDRRKKLNARLAEQGLEGWRQMLANARASDFLRTKFALKLDWVLEPKNFRKVLEGNYGAACRDAAPTPSTDEVQWEARFRGYHPGGLWQEHLWGPRPESGACHAPQQVLERWRGRVAQ